MLGAGGAARAAVWALARRGRRGRGLEPDRRPSGADAPACARSSAASAGRPSPRQADAYELIVNTTAVGLRGEDPFEQLPLRRDGFAPGQVVVDMVYGEAPERAAGRRRGAGATTVDGIEVLVQQGALSLRIWTGREPPLDVMRAAARG